MQFLWNDFFTCFCRSQNSFFFLIWWIVSEIFLHIRGQSCSLATRLHTHIHYIYKVPNMGPLLPKYSIVLTTKKTFIVIKTIKKTRDLENEIENEVTNSGILNSGTFFSSASCKVIKFPLVLDLMHGCYVISFPDVLHFSIWRSYCFVAHKKKFKETGLTYCCLSLERVKITRNWKFCPQ